MKCCKINVAGLMLATLLSLSAPLQAQQGLSTRTISGKVSDGKNGIANVPVTDGVNFVMTDTNGDYSIITTTDAKFVYITTPATYNVSVKGKTIPQFYIPLQADKAGQYDFILTPSKNDDKQHAFVVHSDPQVTSHADLNLYSTVVADCRKTIDSMKGIDVFGFECGDIVGDSPHLFPDYIKTVAPLEIPMFRAIGNHDMDYYGRSHETSYKTFEKYFGPKHYSFNRGNAHYIVIDNNFFLGRDYFYMGYIDEKTFKWMEQDLANVKPGSLVFLFMHIPSQLTKEVQPFQYGYEPIADQTVNAHALHKFLENYNVHIITGHMHYNLNIEFNDKLMEHNTASACGTWWQVPECLDGSPRGYAVYEVDGDNVKWYYKGANHDRDYQMRTYGIGESEEYPNDVVVNVWNYDSKWEVELMENGKVTTKMEQFTGYDPLSKAQCSDRSKIKYEWIYPMKNHHMFHATPKDKTAKLQVKVTDRFGKVYIQDVK